MQHTKRVQFTAPVNRPPTIEFDQSVMAWYIRFRNAKVSKTVSEDAPGCVYAVDLDERGQVIGFELLGIPQFTIEMVRKFALVDTSHVDFDRAKFMPANSREPVEA